MTTSVDSVHVEPADDGRPETFPNAAFRAYWTAVSLNQLGSAVNLVAVPIIAVVTLGAQPTQMAWLVATGLLPSLLVRVPVAVLSDGLRRRMPALVGCNIIQAAIVGLVPLLWWLDLLSFPALLVIEGAASLLVGVYHALASPILPQVVPKANLVDANGKLSATRSVADIGGPAMASGLLTLLAAPVVLLADAFSFVASALLLTRVRLGAVPPQPEADEDGGTTKAGRVRTVGRMAASLARRAGVQVLVAVGLVNGVVETVLVLFLVNDLQLSPSAVAGLLTVGAAGGVVGGLLVGRLLGRFGNGLTLTVGVVATIASLALLPFARPGWTGATSVVLFELAGSLGGTVIIATVFGGLQGAASLGVVARVMALASTLLQVAALVGAAVGGVLGTLLGVRATITVGLALMVLTLIPQVARWGVARWKVDTTEIRT